MLCGPHVPALRDSKHPRSVYTVSHPGPLAARSTDGTSGFILPPDCPEWSATAATNPEFVVFHASWSSRATFEHEMRCGIAHVKGANVVRFGRARFRMRETGRASTEARCWSQNASLDRPHYAACAPSVPSALPLSSPPPPASPTPRSRYPTSASTTLLSSHGLPRRRNVSPPSRPRRTTLLTASRVHWQVWPHLCGRHIQRPPLWHHDHPNIPILQRLSKVCSRIWCRRSLAHGVPGTDCG